MRLAATERMAPLGEQPLGDLEPADSDEPTLYEPRRSEEELSLSDSAIMELPPGPTGLLGEDVQMTEMPTLALTGRTAPLASGPPADAALPMGPAEAGSPPQGNHPDSRRTAIVLAAMLLGGVLAALIYFFLVR